MSLTAGLDEAREWGRNRCSYVFGMEAAGSYAT